MTLPRTPPPARRRGRRRVRLPLDDGHLGHGPPVRSLVDGGTLTLVTKRKPESSISDDLSSALQQLHIYEAVVVAANDAHAVLDVILEASDPEAAHRALHRRYGFTEVHGWAVMEMQFRRMTAADRGKIAQRRDELATHVADLRAVADGP